MSDERVLVYVPARGGSKGIPRKNLLEVGGLSLVGRAVVSGRRWKRESGRLNVSIVVDTDDPGIAAEGVRWGAEVPFLRAPELAGDDISTADCLIHLLERLAALGREFDTVLVLQPTSPFRTADDIASCMSRYDRFSSPSVISIAPTAHPIELALELGTLGNLTWRRPLPESTVRRQAFPPCWFPSGAVYISDRGLLLAERRFVVPGITVGVPLPLTSSLDIDTPEDLTLSQALTLVDPVGTRALPEVVALTESASVYAAESLQEVLDSLDQAMPRNLVVRWSRQSGRPLAQISQWLGLWRHATGASVGWLHDPSLPEATALALVGGVDFMAVRQLDPLHKVALDELILAVLGEDLGH